MALTRMKLLHLVILLTGCTPLYTAPRVQLAPQVQRDAVLAKLDQLGYQARATEDDVQITERPTRTTRFGATQGFIQERVTVFTKDQKLEVELSFLCKRTDALLGTSAGEVGPGPEWRVCKHVDDEARQRALDTQAALQALTANQAP